MRDDVLTTVLLRIVQTTHEHPDVRKAAIDTLFRMTENNRTIFVPELPERQTTQPHVPEGAGLPDFGMAVQAAFSNQFQQVPDFTVAPLGSPPGTDPTDPTV